MKKIFTLVTIIAITLFTRSIDVYAMPVAVNSVSELQNILTNSTVDGNTVTMTENVDMDNASISILSGNYIIDLNGNTLSSKDGGTIYLCNDTSCTAQLTIQDSSVLKTGKIYNYRHDNVSLEFAVGQFGGSLIINGGEFSSEDNGIWLYKNNSAIINDGTFLGNYGIYKEETSKLIVNGGNIGSATSIYGIISSGNIIINGGNIKGINGIRIGISNNYTSHITINDGNIIGSDTGIKFYNVNAAVNSNNEPDKVKINIKGGFFQGKMAVLLQQQLNGYLKFSGGHFVSTLPEDNTNGAITIIKAIIPMNISYDITLNDYLLEGYIYSKDIIEIGRDGYGYISSNPTYIYSSSANDVYVTKTLKVNMVDNIVNGTVTVNNNKAIKGDIIELNIIPNEGYKVKRVLVNNTEIINNDNNYSFVMNEEDALIDVEFEKITKNPETFDNIIFYYILGCFSLISSAIIYIKIKLHN